MKKQEQEDLILLNEPDPPHYKEITQDAQLSQNYHQQLTTITFPAQSLIDLHQPEALSSKVKLKNYDDFLLNRQVHVEVPELIKEGYLTSYKLYKIRSKKKDSAAYDTTVSRRFNDFQFLHYQLVQNYGGYVLPRLPQKNFLAKLNLETQLFQELRTQDLQKYIDKLLHHSRLRYCRQLKLFLFEQNYDFSFNKGEYISQNSTIQHIKSLSQSVYSLTKDVYAKMMGTRERKALFSKDEQQQKQLRMFQREIQDLLKVTQQIKHILEQARQQFTLIHQLSISSEQPHLSSIGLQQNYFALYESLCLQFEDISSFIQNCHDAILRIKILRAQIEDLQYEQQAIVSKQKDNPRNRDLDMIRNRIQKADVKYSRWIGSLKKELQVYTSQGKTMMGEFVNKFGRLKAQIYAHS